MLVLLLAVPWLAQGQTVEKGEWLEGMKTIVPTFFCGEEQYFWQCFEVTFEECEEAAASATRVCINDKAEQIPDVLQMPRDGEYWGSQIGQCAGVGYEARLRDRRINDPVCNNPRNWGAR